MKGLFRNPAVWLALVSFAGLTILLFLNFPVAATVSYGGLISYVIVRRVSYSLRLRRRGYRLRFFGPEIFFYEETAVAGGIQCLRFMYGHVSRGKLAIYWPSHDAWQQGMPDWAKGRREEILGRIRSELGSQFAKCLETESVE